MRRAGFTLVELLLAVALLGALAVFLLPELGKDLERRSLVESSDRLRSLIVMAHAKAVQDGRRYRLQFPGTPDPLDRHANREIAVPTETLQPEVLRQSDPLGNPDAYEGFEAAWKDHTVLQPGTRCVAVLAGRPSFDILPQSPIAGPSITKGQTSYVPLTLNPDGTCDWVTFVLTDLPYDVDVQSYHAPRILNVIVDGRTGQVWVQRAMRVEEVELMQEHGASPILHIDYTRGDLITEANILQIHVRQGRAVGGRSPR